MLMIVAIALGGASVANPGAKFERFPKHLLVRSSASDRQLSRRFTDIGAVEAYSNALAHVFALGGASIGAA
jgi:hypothetical protein